MSDAHTPSCCQESSKKKNLFLNKSFIAIAVMALLISLSCCWPALAKFRENTLMVVHMVWWAVGLGFILGGLLDRFIPREYISHLLAQKKKRSIFYATLLGFLMSACSHGILALSVELHKKGASTPVVVSFLLASPWANMPITLMLLGFFGLKAFYIILGALFVAFTTGVVFQFLESQQMIEKNQNTIIMEEGYSVIKDIRRRWMERVFSWRNLKTDAWAVLKAAIALADMTLWWILIGIGLSGLAAAFIPAEWFHRYMGASGLGLLATLGLATVMEVCSEGTAPLAFEIYKQTGAFGNAFVFLMAGVVTDLTEIGVIWSNVGKKAAIWIPIVAVPQVILLGIIANCLFR